MINYDLSRIKAVVFDVDGVLSASTVSMDSEGMPVRTLNIKDGYAIQLAEKMGLKCAIITGGSSEDIRKRYAYLGVEDIYLKCAVKIEVYEKFKQRHALTDDEIMYMGDDIPDYEIMKRAGIKAISMYVSQYKGGTGGARDVLEQVLKAQGHWLSNAKAFGW